MRLLFLAALVGFAVHRLAAQLRISVGAGAGISGSTDESLSYGTGAPVVMGEIVRPLLPRHRPRRRGRLLERERVARRVRHGARAGAPAGHSTLLQGRTRLRQRRSDGKGNVERTRRSARRDVRHHVSRRSGRTHGVHQRPARPRETAQRADGRRGLGHYVALRFSTRARGRGVIYAT